LHRTLTQFIPVNTQFAASLSIFGAREDLLLKRRHLHIFLCLFLAVRVAGQGPRQYTFTHYGVSSGLASNEASASLQDEQGFIWIATNNGLQRFDGHRYLNFRHEKTDSTTIPNNYVTNLLLDKKKNLWVLTGDGKVGIFNKKKFTYEEVAVKIKDPRLLTVERELVEDEQGNLFLIFHNNEFLTWSGQRKEFAATHNFINLPPDFKIVDIIQQPGTKKYWLGRGFSEPGKP